MNNKYTYRENEVIVNTDNGFEIIEYVDNIEDILKSQNNIEYIENKIEMYEHSLNRKIKSRKDAKLIFNIMTICSVLAGIFFGAVGLTSGVVSIALKMATMAFGIFLGGGALVSLALMSVDNSGKKVLNKLKDKISVCKYELEQEKKKLNKLDKQSKKIDAPKNKEIINLPTSYQIDNLQHKLTILEKFKQDPNFYIEAYNNGNLTNTLDINSTNFMEDMTLIKYLIDEYKKQQIEKENVKSKTKSKNKR